MQVAWAFPQAHHYRQPGLGSFGLGGHRGRNRLEWKIV
jgi:hypothetical protein